MKKIKKLLIDNLTTVQVVLTILALCLYIKFLFFIGLKELMDMNIYKWLGAIGISMLGVFIVKLHDNQILNLKLLENINKVFGVISFLTLLLAGTIIQVYDMTDGQAIMLSVFVMSTLYIRYGIALYKSEMNDTPDKVLLYLGSSIGSLIGTAIANYIMPDSLPYDNFVLFVIVMVFQLFILYSILMRYIEK